MYNSALNLTRLLGIAAIAAIVSGCGSGGDSSDDVPTPPAGTARIAGEVTSGGAAVQDAVVNFQTTDATGNNKSHETLTNAGGKFTLDMPLAEVTGVKQPAGTVTKDGYEPQTLICAGFSSGNVTCRADIVLTKLAENLSIPVGGDTLLHLGDGKYQGERNSQLQKTVPDGQVLEFPIPDWFTQVAKNKATKATVVLDHRGWEAGKCRGTISLIGDASTVTLAGADSLETGEWSGAHQEANPFTFEVSQVGSISATVRIEAGECKGSPDPDLDDFEINRMRVYFCGTDYQGKHGSCIPAE
jgi:hypothetical protein